VIITKEKSSQPEKRFQSAQPISVDHSVFQEGKGLLDLSMNNKPALSMSSSFDQMMRRIEVEQKHDSAVNEVLEEIDD